MLSPEFIDGLLKAAVLMATPLILASIGGVYAERSGIFPIGMEGMMLAGAFASVVGSKYTGNAFLGSFLGMAIGVVLALIFAYLTVSRYADQMVIGLALNLLALGLTNWLAPIILGGEMARVSLFPVLTPPAWRTIPVIGPMLLAQPVIVWIALLLPLISARVLYHTTWGLNIRAVGENPDAAVAAGLSVVGQRYLGVIIQGAFAGLAGSALALAELGLFVSNMTAARGFIVLASHVVGRWDPISVALACLLFGTADAFAIRVQLFRVAIPYQAIVAIPYVITIVALAGLVGRTRPPKALGKAYKEVGR